MTKPVTKRKNKIKPRKKGPRDIFHKPPSRLESDAPREEEQWVSRQKQMGGPTNPSAIPPGLIGSSEFTEQTLAKIWISKNCKFAKRDLNEDRFK